MMTETEGLDVEQSLLASRILFLTQEISQEVVSDLIRQIMVLDGINNEPIELYINSPGGEVHSGLALYDVMRMVSSPIHTFAIGNCCSMAAILLAAGDVRYAFPSATIMIHQPSGGVVGKSDEMQVYTKEMKRVHELLNKILVKHTKRPLKTVRKDVAQDRWMSAKEAQKYGIVDKILTGRK